MKLGVRIFFINIFLYFPLLAAALPSQINPVNERLVLVDPRTHEWGAYDAYGRLIRQGLASAGANWCSDINSPCRTHTGSFRVFFLGDSGCYSTRFPIPNGGAPMPYCMYFNGNQALHGSPNVVHGNISHGCVRMHVGDARWLRYNFVQGPSYENSYQGTLVIIRPY